jgi:hypothetical protein
MGGCQMQSHTGSTYTVGLCRFGYMEEAFRQLDIMLEKGLQLTVGLDTWKRHSGNWISC